MSTSLNSWCSWCYKKTNHDLVDQNYLRRNVYKCRSCKNHTLVCRYCKNMARGGDKYDDECCAEHDGTVKSFETLNMKFDKLEDYKQFFKPKATNVKSVAKISAAVVGGAAVIGPAALLAAPGIGSAVGASIITSSSGTMLSGAVATKAGLAAIGGGSLASGGLGMVGGITIISGAGAAVGGTLGGVVANSYFGAIKDFEIRKVRSGKGPAVIFVDGWLSQKRPGLAEWEEGLEKNYPNNPWYEIKWESKRLKDIGKLIASSTGKGALKKGLKEAAKRASRGAARKISPISWLYDLFVLSKNPWHTAMFRASMTGNLLADILARVKRKQFILLGHSLGARVVFYTLSSLGTKASQRVQVAHLLGGAVGRDDRDGWKLAVNATKSGIRNYYSENDDVLHYFYKVGTFFQSDPIGRSPLRPPIRGFRNYNVTRHVKGHAYYKPNLGKILVV